MEVDMAGAGPLMTPSTNDTVMRMVMRQYEDLQERADPRVKAGHNTFSRSMSTKIGNFSRKQHSRN